MPKGSAALEKTVRVLHIEDNDPIARIVAGILEDNTVGAYAVHRVGTQADALAYARDHTVDVVLTDLGLPDSRGIGGLRTLRNALPDTTPVVVLSGEDDLSVRRKAYELGVAAYLDKMALSATALESCLLVALQDGRHRQRTRAVVNRKMNSQSRKTITMLTRALHLHHSATVEHALRVAEIAHAIARKMGLSEVHAEAIRTAGRLHDVGKIMLSVDGILDKHEPLSALDWHRITEHPQAAYDVLSSVEWPWPIAEIVLQHHERLDGSGYPAGRRGDAIMLEARILAVADAFDARSRRQDRTNEFGIDVALAHLREGSGTLYDPVVVDACCDIFERPAALADPQEEQAEPARPSLLVIDDEPAMGRSIQRSLLGLDNIAVSLATDGASGLDLARRILPGMILLDIRMPGMDGMAVLQALKTEPKTETIPIVMLTAVDDRETMRAALTLGVDDYLTKPVPPDWLREVVASRLAPHNNTSN